MKPFRLQEEASDDVCEAESKPQNLNPAWPSLGYPGIQQQIEILVSGPCKQTVSGVCVCLSQAESDRTLSFCT